MPFTYPFPRPALTADVVLFAVRRGELSVLLIERKKAPFAGALALPGGFVDANEALDRAALRELKEETGVTDVRVEQLGAFGDPGRDPRGHTVSVAYVGFAMTEPRVRAGDDARAATFVPVRRLALPSRRKNAKGRRTPLLALAFDHAYILERALDHLEELLLHFRATRLDLVPEHFTFQELQHVYEVVLGKPFVAAKFRARLLDLGLIVPVDGKAARHHPARLYRWRTKRG